MFTCTNFSSKTASLGFVMRDSAGTVVLDQSTSLGSLDTFTYSTKATVSHSELIMGANGSFRNASMAIASDELEVRCIGKIVDAAATAPTNSYVLQPVRFNQSARDSE